MFADPATTELQAQVTSIVARTGVDKDDDDPAVTHAQRLAQLKHDHAHVDEVPADVPVANLTMRQLLIRLLQGQQALAGGQQALQ